MRKFSVPLLLTAAFLGVFTYCGDNGSNPVEKQQEEPKVNHHCAETIEVSSPGAGEIHYVGDTLEISFCADTNYQILVSISFDGEVNWHDLGQCSPFSPNDPEAWSPRPGTILWPIPPVAVSPDGETSLETVSENCRVIAYRLDGAEQAYSEGYFTIGER